MGQVLTPELCAAIEVDASRPVDRSIPLGQFTPLVKGDYVIQIERFAAVQDELHPLHLLHWRETEKHRAGLAMLPDYQAMRDDDRAGRMLQFTVRHADTRQLVGNLRMYVYPSRHSQTLSASEDTLFLLPEHRGGHLVLHLLRYMESCMRKLGVREINGNSKTLNRADVLLRRLGYTEVAIQFHKFLEETPNVQ